MPWPTLPRFLLCEPLSTRLEDSRLVLHTQSPRLILECLPGGTGALGMIDAAPPDSEDVRRAAQEAHEWFTGETATLETTAIFLRYRSMYDWLLGERPSDELAFHATYAQADALAAELTTSGATVHGVLFEATRYRKWLARRGDSVERRVEWAVEQLATPGPNLWTFTLGDPPALEPVSPQLRAKYGDDSERMGWGRVRPHAGV